MIILAFFSILKDRRKRKVRREFLQPAKGYFGIVTGGFAKCDLINSTKAIQFS